MSSAIALRSGSVERKPRTEREQSLIFCDHFFVHSTRFFFLSHYRCSSPPFILIPQSSSFTFSSGNVLSTHTSHRVVTRSARFLHCVFRFLTFAITISRLVFVLRLKTIFFSPLPFFLLNSSFLALFHNSSWALLRFPLLLRHFLH